MAKKPERPELENGDNWQGMPSIQDLLQAIAQNQQELSDRLSDLEEATGKQGDSTRVNIATMFFKPEDKFLPDFSWISPLAARPLAEALALDEMTTERVRSGEMSLNKLVIQNWLHFQRGVRGRLMGIGKEAMEGQVSAEAAKEEENMPDFEAGKE